MQVNDLVRKCVLFIGKNTEAGFSVEGTGFVYCWTKDDVAWQHIVTAWHVVDALGDEAHFRINSHLGPPSVFAALRNQWIRHPDKTVDLCCLPCDLSRWKQLDYLNLEPTRHNLTKAVIDEHNIGLGENVFLPGAYTKLIGETKNIAVVRTGSIAAMPEEPIPDASPKRPAYLVEVRSLGGISGSPVFVHMPPPVARHKFKPTTTLPHPADPPKESRYKFLMGVVIGRHDLHHPPDIAPGSEPATDALFNSGLAVVLPIDLVVEMIEQPHLLEERAAMTKKIKENTGYRPLSSTVPKQVDENPGSNPHGKEDFTALLRAAAKTKPQAE